MSEEDTAVGEKGGKEIRKRQDDRGMRKEVRLEYELLFFTCYAGV
jgi:hypothetical protein